MTKRKKRTTRRSKKKSFPYVKILLILSLIVLISGVFSYFFYKKGYDDGYNRASLIAKQKIDIINREKSIILSEIEDYKNSLKNIEKKDLIKKENPKKEISKKKTTFKKPKLAIIIDDVSFGYQVRELKNLHIPITLSFFPPTKRHPNTPKYAKEFKIYMVHLPLEAKHFKHPEENTLLVSSTKEEIEKRVKNILKWFPNVKYINNHTGSTFTSNKDAMEKLIEVLNRYNIQFIDSRTVATTKVKEVEEEFGNRYISKDIFLDNKQDIDYIKNQLKKAIYLAKKRGYAIAIGHPHPKTIEALKESKDILKRVKLVYINQI